MLLFLGCADPDGSRAPPPDTVGGGESTFAGIERASWDGSDGLVATWSAMAGAASYMVEASDWQPIGDEAAPTTDTVSVTVDSGTSAPCRGSRTGPGTYG